MSGARKASGRRRNEDAREAILQAATELLVERGYSAVSIEAIAQRAGAGKQTIYRWWPSKGDVLMDALTRKADLRIPLKDEGSWTADLRSLLANSFALARVPQIAELLRALMVAAQTDAEFGARFQTDFLQRRRAAILALVDRAHQRGDLPKGLTADFAADVILGVLWYRLLVHPQNFDDELAQRLVGQLSVDVGE